MPHIACIAAILLSLWLSGNGRSQAAPNSSVCDGWTLVETALDDRPATRTSSLGNGSIERHQPEPDDAAAPSPRADSEPAALIDRVDAERLMATLAALPPSRAARGGEENERALVETETWLGDQLRTLGYDPTIQPISAPGPAFEGGPERWSNLIVDIPGTAAREADVPAPVLILSAHFDSVQGSPGADDDGTGVAALLEIAQILQDNPQPTTIRLAFFNLEEAGLVGSRSYCSEVLRPLIRGKQEAIVGMVSLEMLGYFTDEPDSQASPLKVLPDGSPAPTVGDFIALVGIAAHQEFSAAFAEAMARGEPEMPVHRADYFPIPIPDILRSDHAPFLLLGVPAVMLTDTANFRNPHYHRASDSIATIDRERFTLVVRGVLAATIELAGGMAEDETGH